MRLRTLVVVACSVVCGAQSGSPLTMQVSAPTRFLSAHGRRAWVAGYSNAGMEVWAGALQIASDVHPEFRRAGDETVIPGSQLVSRMDVSPSHVSRTYIGPGFSVEEQIWVPLNDPAAVFRYTVRSTREVEVIVRFHASLNLMWPAALGGQEIRWDRTQSGYLLSEPTQQFAAAVLAPGARSYDEPLNAARAFSEQDELAIALDSRSPEVLFARLPGPHAGTPAGLELAAAQRLLAGSDWQQQSMQHEDEVLSSGVRIETPDPDVNRALDWAVIALDQDWFCNDDLGCAYVAGFGPSRRNRRPQYAWFFAGDGLIALHGALARGELDRAREELRFISRYQDAKTGMIWHELSQSAPYLNWRGKYPYMFVHADVTYPYISSVAEYVRASNDREFLREMWPSVQKAFAYGRSLIPNSGLPQIPYGKLGADEQEPHSDELGLSASWVSACRDYAQLAELMGDAQAAQGTRQLAEKARAAFAQRYWDTQRNLPVQAFTRNGEAVHDRGIASIGAVNQHLFDAGRSDRVLDAIASWQFQSDWGTRNIAMTDPGFDPASYAHGSVWALATAEVSRAYWAAHRPDIAWEIWRRLVPWSTLDSPGHMHEVLAGDIYQPQEESVPEQTWSSAAFLYSALQGLFGLEVDEEERIVTLAPHLPPDWNSVTLKGVKMEGQSLNFTLRQGLGELSLRIEAPAGSVHLRFEPEIPLGARVASATACGRRAAAHLETHDQDEHASLDFVVPKGSCDVSIQYRDGVAILMPAVHPSLGNPSTGTELTSLRLKKNSLQLDLDVIPSLENKIWIRTQRPIVSATAANVQQVNQDVYELRLGATEKTSSYKQRHVSVTFTPTAIR